MRKLRMSELNRISVEEFKHTNKHPYVIILDDVRSILNVGSVFRTADAFKCQEVLLGKLCPEPNKEMNKTALGGTDSVNWRKPESLQNEVKALKNNGFQIWAVEQTTNATSLLDWEIPENAKVAFIMGNEVSGVSDELLQHCHGSIEIPQYGTKHSLNISVSTGIVMWDYIKQYKTRKAR